MNYMNARSLVVAASLLSVLFAGVTADAHPKSPKGKAGQARKMISCDAADIEAKKKEFGLETTYETGKDQNFDFIEIFANRATGNWIAVGTPGKAMINEERISDRAKLSAESRCYAAKGSHYPEDLERMGIYKHIQRGKSL